MFCYSRNDTLLSMSYKKDVIPTLEFFTLQLQKGSKERQLMKNEEAKSRTAAVGGLRKCRLGESISSTTDTKVGPAYSRKKNAKKKSNW